MDCVSLMTVAEAEPSNLVISVRILNRMFVHTGFTVKIILNFRHASRSRLYNSNNERFLSTNDAGTSFDLVERSTVTELSRSTEYFPLLLSKKTSRSIRMVCI